MTSSLNSANVTRVETVKASVMGDEEDDGADPTDENEDAGEDENSEDSWDSDEDEVDEEDRSDAGLDEADGDDKAGAADEAVESATGAVPDSYENLSTTAVTTSCVEPLRLRSMEKACSAADEDSKSIRNQNVAVQTGHSTTSEGESGRGQAYHRDAECHLMLSNRRSA
jgi:hypothetical protein